MAIEQGLKFRWNEGGAYHSKRVSDTASSAISILENVPDGTTDQEVSISLDIDQIKILYIAADQNLTLETNSGSSPDDTINLLAGVPLAWHVNSYFSNPFSVDIASIFLSNSAGADAEFVLEALQEASP